MKEQHGFDTRAIHIGEEPNFEPGGTGDVVASIQLSTTYARQKVQEPTAGHEYGRSDNPTRLTYEKKLATLEGAQYGLAFASGLAAETTVALALLTDKKNLLAGDDLYGGTVRLFNKVLKPFGINTTYVDTTNPNNVAQAINANTGLVWIETPSNPLLKVTDIKAVAQICQQHGVPLLVDNTFLSPVFQNPLALGADIALHSTSKYINGHSDVIGGAVMTNSDDLHTKIKFVQNAAGGVPSPFDCYMAMRGLKTLGARMRQHQANAIEVAKFLEQHPAVQSVAYPGLHSHPQHAIATRQGSGFGGMVTFVLKGGLPAAETFLASVKVFLLAESLGGVESLIEHPALMTHASVAPEVRQQIGISDGLVRVSCGIENTTDLINDLKQALDNL